jgi:PRTRC genetic system protein C
MEVKTLTRSFKYNGIGLTDPDPGKTPDQVRAIYAYQYPELLNAVIEGPVTKGGVSTYTFARAAGSKGVGHLPAMRAIRARKSRAAKTPVEGATPEQIKENKECASTVKAVVNNQARSTVVQPDPSSYSRFG